MKNTSIYLLTFLLVSVLCEKVNAQKYPIYVGTYTSNNNSKGVYIYDFDEQTLKATIKDSIVTSNPSFILRDDNKLYAVNEDGLGKLSSIDLLSKRILNSQETEGAHPCHVSKSPNAPLLVVSNYSGGSLSLFSIKEDGSLNHMEDFIQFSGSSVNKDRQKQSHIHSAFFSNDGNKIYVSDLGADLIYVFGIEKSEEGYYLVNEGEIETKKGGGPRHVAFSKDGLTLYSVLEMTGEIEVFQFINDKWTSKQFVNIFSKNFKGENGAADIKIDSEGKYLYASNRLDADVVVSYQVLSNGLLKQHDLHTSVGKGPRNINISPSGNLIFLTNQLSNQINILKISNGKFKDTGLKIEIPKPVCIIF